MLPRLFRSPSAFLSTRLLRSAAVAATLALLFASGCSRPGDERAGAAASASAGNDGSRTTVQGNGFVLVDLGVEPAPLSQLLEREASKAGEQGLRTYVEFGATWCVPCQKLRKAMHTEPVAGALRGAYIVAIDVDAWGGRLGEAGFTVGSIPVIFELDASGLPTKRKIDGRAFGDDDPTKIASAMRSFIQPL